MPSFTLDWNAVIALENAEPEGADVSALIEAHRKKRADVALVATSASENSREKRFPEDYHVFARRIEGLGINDLPVLLTPGVFGLTFFDHCYFVDEDRYNTQVSALWSTLFPSIKSPIAGVDFPLKDEGGLWQPEFARWRNAWCDIHSLISHIDAGRDVFVTSNTTDFQRHAAALATLGAGSIMTPADAILAI
jgi:hypothetical protein